MTDAAVTRFMVLVHELRDARAAAGGTLSQDEEADRAEALDDLWSEMTDDEHKVVEERLRLLNPGRAVEE